VATIPFAFADIFAGIGGFRRGLEAAGGRCAYTVEWDAKAREAYLGDMARTHPAIARVNPRTLEGQAAGHRFDSNVRDVVRQVESGMELPPFSVLAGGFPCQPFSLAGVSKKTSLGRPHGFEDKHQGDLFFELAKLIRATRPPILLLENVKNLLSHERGRTYGRVRAVLEGGSAPEHGIYAGDLDYNVTEAIVDASAWVPQHRERLFIVGLNRDWFGDQCFVFPSRPSQRPVSLADIVRPLPREAKYRLSDRLWAYLQGYAETHRAKGNGFGCAVIDLESADASTVTRTLSARYYKDGSEILIRDIPDANPRRLTPSECAELMGFGDFAPHPSDQAAYKQFGNGVVAPVVSWIAEAMQAQGLIQQAVVDPPADPFASSSTATQMSLGLRESAA
jgi:DNA (cytosine-5)-methyltransferase 1